MNFTVPTSYLTPELVYQVTISSYILVGSCAVMIWDVLTNIQSDWRFLVQWTISMPTIVYFLSRFVSLGYILGSTVFETAPIGHCAIVEKAINWLYVLAVPATSFLFLLRVWAVYDRNKVAVGFFAGMWLAVLAGCLTVTHGGTGASIGPTKYCLSSKVEQYTSAAAILPLVNDSLIFFAISYRIVINGYLDNDRRRTARALICGVGLPSMSREILRGGQSYYLTTVCCNLLTVVMLFITSVPAAYCAMFVVPNVALMNIMACKAFRELRFRSRDSGSLFDMGALDNDSSLHHGSTAQQSIELVTFSINQGQSAPVDSQSTLALGDPTQLNDTTTDRLNKHDV